MYFRPFEMNSTLKVLFGGPQVQGPDLLLPPVHQRQGDPGGSVDQAEGDAVQEEILGDGLAAGEPEYPASDGVGAGLPDIEGP